MDNNSKYHEELKRIALKHTRYDFDIPHIDEQYPPFSHHIVRLIKSLSDIPDLRHYKDIFVLSDYGGEHKGASFYTYTCLICASDPLDVYFKEVNNLFGDYWKETKKKEINYKNLNNGEIARRIEKFLEINNRYVPGFLINLGIEKSIKSVFGIKSLENTIQYLSDNNLGNWKKKPAEKLLRVAHLLAIFIVLTTSNGQKFLWLSDNDSINNEGKSRNFQHTIDIFMKILQMYTNNSYEIHGFAKQFDFPTDSKIIPFYNKINSLLSVTDLAAGAFQDILNQKISGKKYELKKEKIPVIEWMAREGISLRKMNIVVTKKNECDWDMGLVNLGLINNSKTVEISI